VADLGGFLAAIGLGVAATVTPCILPLYPAFIAYVTGGGSAATGTVRVPPMLAALLVCSLW